MAREAPPATILPLRNLLDHAASHCQTPIVEAQQAALSPLGHLTCKRVVSKQLLSLLYPANIARFFVVDRRQSECAVSPSLPRASRLADAAGL